jgi:hypothetical protein
MRVGGYFAKNSDFAIAKKHCAAQDLYDKQYHSHYFEVIACLKYDRLGLTSFHSRIE